VTVQDDSVDAARTRVVTWADPAAFAGAAAGRTGLEFIQAMAAGEVPPPPIFSIINARLEQVAEGEVEFSLQPAEYHYNPIGSVHGGVYATILDSATGCAVHTMLPEGVGYTSLDLSVKFLRAMRVATGTVTCTGRVVHLGHRTALAEATLATASGTLLATATSSCLILRP
jgi:uncharacterized protein (TIGR00369 family)